MRGRGESLAPWSSQKRMETADKCGPVADSDSDDTGQADVCRAEVPEDRKHATKSRARTQPLDVGSSAQLEEDSSVRYATPA